MSRIALAFRWTLLIVSSAVVGCDPAPVPPPTASAAPTATTAAPVTSLPPPQRPTVVPLESEWEAAPAIAVQGAAALGCAGSHGVRVRGLLAYTPQRVSARSVWSSPSLYEAKQTAL